MIGGWGYHNWLIHKGSHRFTLISLLWSGHWSQPSQSWAWALGPSHSRVDIVPERWPSSARNHPIFAGGNGLIIVYCTHRWLSDEDRFSSPFPCFSMFQWEFSNQNSCPSEICHSFHAIFQAEPSADSQCDVQRLRSGWMWTAGLLLLPMTANGDSVGIFTENVWWDYLNMWWKLKYITKQDVFGWWLSHLSEKDPLVNELGSSSQVGLKIVSQNSFTRLNIGYFALCCMTLRCVALTFC